MTQTNFFQRNFLFIIWFCSFALPSVSSYAQSDYFLQWKLLGKTEINYAMLEENINDAGQLAAVDTAVLLEDKSSRLQALKQLRELKAPSAQFSLRVQNKGDYFRAWAKVRAPEPSDRFMTSGERQRQNILEANQGNDKLIVDFQSNGVHDFFFLSLAQKNLANLYFLLPQGRISLGDRWDMPQHLVTLLPNFVSEQSDHFSFAILEGTTLNTAGQRIAEITFLANSLVKGEQRALIRPNPEESIILREQVQAQLLGYGYFLIDEGYWSALKVLSISETSSGGRSYRLRSLEIE